MREAIETAAAQLRRYLPVTPLQHSPAFSAATGCQVHLKLESVQPIRAFKVRGALNKVMRLHPEQRPAGVVTASAGNHGLGVAYAARLFEIPASVYVPDNANQLKVAAIERLGARVVRAGLSYHEAYLAALNDGGGATFVHAYDDPEVIAGQGTVAVELLEQLPEFDTLLVGVGGGGLISGIAAYLRAARPQVRIHGVQPEGASSLKRSLDAGRIVTLDRVDTIADGLAAVAPGEIAFDICRRSLEGVYLVSDDEMLRAVRLYFEWEHLLSEPAGAAALAALLHHHAPAADERVVVVLSGANIDDRVMIEALRTR